jgi:hypothetical protein
VLQNYSRQREIRELANTLFDRAWWRGWWARLFARFTGKPRHIPLLSEARELLGTINAQLPQRRTIRVEHIIGSAGTLNFDCDFFPLHQRGRDRWIAVAQAMLDDPTNLPPIQAVQVGDRYYIVDGHHRVSAAKMLDHLYIDADLTVWESKLSA